MKIAEIDAKGRLVIPKEIRTQSAIRIPGQVSIKVEGKGRITIESVEVTLGRAQEIGRKKLSAWSEERHEEDKAALRLVRKGNSS